MNFHGVKVALLLDGKVLTVLRDDKPGLFNANMWDLPDGGREHDESPIECAIREVYEELELQLTPEDIVWCKAFPAQKDPSQIAYFCVAEIDNTRITQVTLHEGQRWQLMSLQEFFARADVIEALKLRLQSYVDQALSTEYTHKT